MSLGDTSSGRTKLYLSASLARYLQTTAGLVFITPQHLLVRLGDEWVGLDHYLNTLMPKLREKEKGQTMAQRLKELEEELAAAKEQLTAEQRQLKEAQDARLTSAKDLQEATQHLADEVSHNTIFT